MSAKTQGRASPDIAKLLELNPAQTTGSIAVIAAVESKAKH